MTATMTERMAPSWNTYHQKVDPHGTARRHLVDWLRDAHAMELQAEKMLEARAERLEHLPDWRARVQNHITEARQQARDVEQCLGLLGEDTSALKDAGGKATAMLQAMGGMLMDDEVVKGAAASCAFAHMKAAVYASLVVAAQAAGVPGVAQACERIRQQEREMAAWLEEHIPAVVETYLTYADADKQSSR